MKKIGFVCLAALSLALAGCSAQSDEHSDAVAEHVRPVRIVVATRSAATANLVYTGEVLPRTQTGFGFKMGGRLIERLVDVGSTVAPGDVLARLDPIDIENQLRSSEADLASAEAGRDTAQAAFNRQQTLFGNGVITRAQFEAVELEFNAAKARVTNAEAALDIVRENLKQTELKATAAGVVTQIDGNVGQVVAAGQPVVMIASNDQRDAAFDIPEQLIEPKFAQAEVTVALLSYPDISFSSRIREVSPIADPTTRTYRVLVELTGAPEQMFLGAAVTGTIDLGGGDVFRLPSSAITSQDGRPAVFVVDPETLTLERKPVALAQQTSAQIIVGDGLDQGDLVVTAGVSKLRPGQSVRLEDGQK